MYVGIVRACNQEPAWGDQRLEFRLSMRKVLGSIPGEAFFLSRPFFSSLSSSPSFFSSSSCSLRYFNAPTLSYGTLQKKLCESLASSSRTFARGVTSRPFTSMASSDEAINGAWPKAV